jgi:hypothetical protein
MLSLFSSSGYGSKVASHFTSSLACRCPPSPALSVFFSQFASPRKEGKVFANMRRDLVLGGVIFAASAAAVVDVYGESTARIVQKKE